MEKKEAVDAGVGSIPRKDPQPVVRLPLFLLRAKRSKLERSLARSNGESTGGKWEES
jgi:hypothetical protein